MSLSKEKWGYLAASAAALVAVGTAVYLYSYSGSSTATEKDDENVIVVEVDEDEAAQKIKPTLYKKEAMARSKCFSDLHYRIVYAMLPGGKTFRGQVEVKFKLLKEIKKDEDGEEWAFLDYRGKVHQVW